MYGPEFTQLIYHQKNVKERKLNGNERAISVDSPDPSQLYLSSVRYQYYKFVTLRITNIYNTK
jgi:hypothetical protein